MTFGKTKKHITFLLWITLAQICASMALAQPVRRDVLDRVEVERSPRAISIHVYFRFPVNYIRHFPFESGETLLIHIAPTVFEKRDDDSPGREALRPPNDPDVPLTDIVYDERTLWDPYLMLHFSRRVDFRVRQGRDFRSIIVDLPVKPQSEQDLTPTGPKEQPTP